MKKNKMNKYMRWGLVINSITIITIRYIDIPEIISCFLMGAGISLLLVGIVTMNHDMTKMRQFKINLVKKIVSKKHN